MAYDKLEGALARKLLYAACGAFVNRRVIEEQLYVVALRIELSHALTT